MTSQAPPHDEIILVLDFGGQTAQLIARRVRETGVFSMLVHPSTPASELAGYRPKGIILSGGPASIYEPGAPRMDPRVLELGVPVLGVCYGMQLACHMLGCEVNRADHREFGRAALQIKSPGELLHAIPAQTAVWMSHGDQVLGVDRAFDTLASTDTCPHAAVRHRDRVFYGVQFHPEVTHTPHGSEILQNFVFRVCKCRGDWRMTNFMEREIDRVRERVGGGRVLCGLSGGVDSSVVAALLHRAIGDNLTCVFVDNGLLRKNERRLVESTFRDHFSIDLHVADASAEFLSDLAGVTDPQEKRRRIGHRFIDVFKGEADRLEATHGRFAFLAQGTLYPDVIESGHGSTGKAGEGGPAGAGGGGGFSANIKLHHNVGGLPDELGFELVEPLRDLFKDEVRKLGEVLGLPEQLVWRHPFPGPGLAVRVLGEVTPAKLEVLRNCDEILLEEIVSAGLYRQTSQVFAVLLPISSVGVMGDGRTYEQVLAVRAVETQDFMSADWSRLPYDLLARVSNRIINEVRGVNRVVYDISSKPPATIEWE